ncbi:MAG: hydrogenase maturation nickel metallochaperone HypA [Desulfobulbus sp.]|jgi:hydrogenase nickel incorporation protein HypA/HybF|uniref:hydrogenase maturation nickel metallochaperone HypA/HybF n=1 Tax=Desulfobulbus sp. TaxID=895 RepID=UPI00284D2C50|nr:hydrogenase maturation nickel metallochaperone HypA [Desulfobulbus sp.]MDR2549123.1 hydrogenase maturation nickel metallochaperone HypA [Desulfobulbus sp.]
MHELSLAQSLITQILALAAEHGACKVSRVVVTLGPFSGVVRDSFEFGFSILKQEQEPVRDAHLELETPDPEYRCLDCGKVAVIPFPRQSDRLELARCGLATKKCPWCGSNRLSPQGGTELILNQLEME